MNVNILFSILVNEAHNRYSVRLGELRYNIYAKITFLTPVKSQFTVLLNQLLYLILQRRPPLSLSLSVEKPENIAWNAMKIRK